MFTDEQLDHWFTFGFLVERSLFSMDEIDEMRREFDLVMNEELGGQTFDGQKTKTVLWFVERRSKLACLVEDDRIYERVEQILGPGILWALSDGNYYVGDTQWHGGNGEPVVLEHIKVAIYPDSVTNDIGCLRVIPGSQHLEFQKRLKTLNTQCGTSTNIPLGITGENVPAFPLESDPGDVVFFSENLWHGSFGGRSGRRMFTLIYSANPDTDEKRDWLREYRKSTVAMYKPHESFVNSDRPRIRSMVDTYAEL